MIKNSVSVDQLRTNLSQLIGQVMYGNDKVIIKKYNREAAVLLSLDEYEKLVDPTKRFTPQDWQKKFSLMDKIKKRVPKNNQESLAADIEQAIVEVRAQKKAKRN